MPTQTGKTCVYSPLILMVSVLLPSSFAQTRQPDSDGSAISSDATVFTSRLATAPASVFRPASGSAVVTAIGGRSDDQLGLVGVDLSTSFRLPFPAFENTFLSVTPGFGVQFVNPPAGVDLPDELYRASVAFSVMRPLNERMQMLFALAPSFASDLEGGGDEAFRFAAFASLVWQTSETKRWMFGLAATGREDVPLLPTIGLTWTPNEDWQIDIAAPRPKISYRLGHFEGTDQNCVYVAGEFGGGTWSVDREGRDDELNLRDFRLVVGMEQRKPDGMNPRVEAGYVFGRRIEYESDDYSFDPPDAVMLRAAFSF